MQPVSTQILFAVLFLVFPFAVACVLFFLARRTRIAGLWWLFVALGIWPVISMTARQIITGLVAARNTPGDFMIYSLSINTSFALVTAILQIAACVVLARTRTMPPAEPLCPRCGYNLTGLRQDRCPECGTQFTCEVRYLTRAV